MAVYDPGLFHILSCSAAKSEERSQRVGFLQFASEFLLLAELPVAGKKGGAKALRHASSSLLREISGSMVSLTELLSADLTKTDEVWPISFPYPT